MRQDEELQLTKKGKMEIKLIWWNDADLNGVLQDSRLFPGWVKSLIRIQKRVMQAFLPLSLLLKTRQTMQERIPF